MSATKQLLQEARLCLRPCPLASPHVAWAKIDIDIGSSLLMSEHVWEVRVPQGSTFKPISCEARTICWEDGCQAAL